MKGKKRKKGTNSNYKSSASVQAQAAETARIDEEVRERKRLKTLARNILLIDVLMLGVCQLLLSANVINTMAVSVISILGIILMCIALWIQFGKHGRDDNTRTSRW